MFGHRDLYFYLACVCCVLFSIAPAPIARSTDRTAYHGVSVPVVKAHPVNSMARSGKPIFKPGLTHFLKASVHSSDLSAPQPRLKPDFYPSKERPAMNRRHVLSGQSTRKLYFSGDVKKAYFTARDYIERKKGNNDTYWIGGLAAWRLRYYADAARYFEYLARSPSASSLQKAGAAYWTARTHMRLGRVKTVSHWMEVARRYPHTFYGVLASQSLGHSLKVVSSDYDKTAYQWMARRKFKVDPELVHAIILQESRFNPRAKNPSGAAGLMQILPSTASYATKDRRFKQEGGQQLLMNPAINLKAGQTYLSYLLRLPQVKDNLLYLLTAYNAGPGNLNKWKKRTADVNDGLLFIESVPSSETRKYMKVVLYNYWHFTAKNNRVNTSLEALASGRPAMYSRIRLSKAR